MVFNSDLQGLENPSGLEKILGVQTYKVLKTSQVLVFSSSPGIAI